MVVCAGGLTVVCWPFCGTPFISQLVFAASVAPFSGPGSTGWPYGARFVDRVGVVEHTTLRTFQCKLCRLNALALSHLNSVTTYVVTYAFISSTCRCALK